MYGPDTTLLIAFLREDSARCGITESAAATIEGVRRLSGLQQIKLFHVYCVSVAINGKHDRQTYRCLCRCNRDHKYSKHLPFDIFWVEVV